MRTHFIILLAFTFAIIPGAKAQSLDSLNQLNGHEFAVYFSSGHKQRAESIAMHIEKALSFHAQLLEFKPEVTLLVLSPADWKIYTTEALVYGMPHYTENNKRLFVAAEDNAFWKSFLPPLNQLPENLSKAIQVTYSGADKQITMQAFFDLLAVHELGHAFHMQGGLTMQRKWMGELFVNIFLHTYIAEKDPERLPALTLFPRMVVAGGAKEFKYTSLRDIQEHYSEIGRQYPRNYGWYQCRWHSAAAGIYDAGGKKIIRKLWDAFKSKKELLSDTELVSFLKTNVDKSVSDVIEFWDR